MNNGTFQKYLLYVISLAVSMLLWFVIHLAGQVDTVSLEQARRTQRVDSIVALHEETKRLAVQLATVSSTEATLSRHEDLLRRLEDRLNMLRRAPDDGMR